MTDQPIADAQAEEVDAIIVEPADVDDVEELQLDELPDDPIATELGHLHEDAAAGDDDSAAGEEGTE